MYRVVRDQEMQSYSDTGNSKPSLICSDSKAERRLVYAGMFLGQQLQQTLLAFGKSTLSSCCPSLGKDWMNKDLSASPS